jgi:ParB family chromosome partitioning protein
MKNTVVSFVAAPVVIDFSRQGEALSDAAQKVKALAKGKSTIKEVAVGRSDVFRVNPFDLHVKDGYNSRVMDSVENKAHIDWLARSIAKRGVVKPLEVSLGSDGKLYVEDGFCRFFGVRRAMEVYGAEVRSIPVQKVEKGANDADRLVKQIISNSGKPLTALEQGVVVKRLLALGWSIEQTAEEISRSVTHVNNLLELQEAPEQVKKMIAEGAVTATLAQTVLRESKTVDAAVAKLTSAVEKAKVAGKGKATAKHVDGRISPAKAIKEVREAFEAAQGDTETRKALKVAFGTNLPGILKALGIKA